MLTPTPAGAVWPARLAYCAAAIFTLASAGTNLHYGISKGADAPSSAVWGAVSVAVSIVFALSWPALIKAVARREWMLAPMALAALVLTGAYSVTGALGSASGGRANASTAEQLIIDQRTKAQASYAAAQLQLAALTPSRPAAELEALLAASASQLRGRGGCLGAHGAGQAVCPRNTALAAELGRAKRRAELEGKMDAAQAELERIAAPRQANSDAAALVGYLAALGVNIEPDAVNGLLVLLAVLVIECGGGLALAVGLSLSEHPEQRVRRQVFAEQPALRSPSFRANTANTGKEGARTRSERSPNTMVFPPVRNSSRKVVGDKLVMALRERGGPVHSSIRQLARQLGATPTTLHTVAGELMAAGVVSVIAGRRGSVFRLLAT
jgi:hypothetical protein